MDKINYFLSGLDDMDKVIILLNEEDDSICVAKKMILQREEVSRFPACEIAKLDGYISRFENDLEEDYILLNVPDVWFRSDGGKTACREEDYDLVFLPKSAVKSIFSSLETIVKRFIEELKQEA
ncbi:MAG: hypothetical protein LBC99_00245 [Spirochaetota bacterium]|jgi:hypothetical protein|nr:hypothetical protein [Spirochaetota bacterium]